MAGFRLASWNVNSVRLRAPQVLDFLHAEAPDVLCLQEIKCRNEEFPAQAFADAGYGHQMVRGQKGLHGVAILSRHALTEQPDPPFCRHGHARVALARIGQTSICNLYVPAGGDEPEPDKNEKFAHKLDFLAKLRDFFAARRAQDPDEQIILAGDLNIAPLPSDVWSHKKLLKVVSHTPIEVAALAEVQQAGDFTDTARALIDEPEPVFTWWSYRAKDWQVHNRGRRLDHIWVSPALKDAALSPGRDGFAAFSDCRSWERPSDHIPVMQTLAPFAP